MAIVMLFAYDRGFCKILRLFKFYLQKANRIKEIDLILCLFIDKDGVSSIEAIFLKKSRLELNISNLI